MTIIDPGVGELLPLSFVRAELARYPIIQSVGLNPFLWPEKRCWGAYNYVLKRIILDPNIPPASLAILLNKKHDGLELTEDEAWRFVFFHETHHSKCGPDEEEADRYARQRIIEMRKLAASIHVDLKRGVVTIDIDVEGLCQQAVKTALGRE